MRVLILRSISFSDKVEDPFINKIIKGYQDRGYEVAVYSMPACNDVEHWAGFAIADYNMWSDMMICIDFPAALIAHRKKRIILTKSLPKNPEFQLAIDSAIKESLDCYKCRGLDYEYEDFPEEIITYISKGEK